MRHRAVRRRTAIRPFTMRSSAMAVCTVLFGAEAIAQQESTTLPAVNVKASQYDADDVRPEGVTTATKTYLAPKDIPQTIDTLDVNKYKSYGINDLSIMLDGVPGVNTTYDMRGEGVYIRGFQADSGDIYRDGVRESGQVRRSTANVERIEILKGPASVLYGRSAGGGIVNLVSKQARFDAKSSVTLRGGSWDNYGGTIDINQVVNPNMVLRLTADREQAHSFRSGIRNRNEMVSPSILIDTRTGLRWTAQYTYDNVWRVPDRGPSYETLPAGVSIRTGFQHPGDYVEDRLRVARSDLVYEFNPAWSLRWVASKREASQDFDHYFAGTYNAATGLVRPNYAWQQTNNKTTSNTLDLTGKFKTGSIEHDLLVGLEASEELRQPRLATVTQTFSYDPFNPNPAAWPTRPSQGSPTQHNRHEGETEALYLQDLISITPEWKLLVGLRHDRFKFHTTNYVSGLARGYDGSSNSPRVGVVWQPVPTQSLYASYSKSYSPYGGRGILSVDVAANAVYDDAPQHSRQFELGIKSDWLGGALSTQLAVYQLEHYNIRYRPDAVNDPFTWAIRGKERSRGVEFSASGQVAKGWYVRGGAGVMSAKVTEDAQVPTNEGLYLNGSAKRNGNLFLRYAPEGPWYGEIGVTHTSARWANAANTSQVPGYSRWDALVGWRSAPWTVTAAVSNLLDKEYWRSTSMPGAPRSFLLSANYQF
jgi:iron complex outermembrane receptor protein